MCGRYTLSSNYHDLEVRFSFKGLDLDYRPRYNIAPSQKVLTVTNEEDINTKFMRWGLIPSWAKDPKIGNRMINARCETVAEKPSFQAAFRRRRCLVPATGFYEWQKTGGREKQPWHIHRPDDSPLAFAGIWERWEADDGSALETCAIITTAANSRMDPIHHRMPVILAPDDYGTWTGGDAEGARGLCRAWAGPLTLDRTQQPWAGGAAQATLL